jgi:hypothetical protein
MVWAVLIYLWWTSKSAPQEEEIQVTVDSASGGVKGKAGVSASSGFTPIEADAGPVSVPE